MYKILIGQMDKSDSDSLESYIVDNFKEAKVVGTVTSGNDVISETINKEPDLILIAVRMKGLNGLETIRQIRKFNQFVHVIIVSNYDYFEFAREAMQLKVSNYLVKPIHKNMFVKALKQEFESIKEEKRTAKRFEQDSMMLNDSIDFVEQNFIYSIVYNGNYEYELKKYKEILPIENEGYVLNVELDPASLVKYWSVDLGHAKILSILKKTIKDEVNGIIGPKISNRIVVYVPCKTESEDAKELKVKAIFYANKIIKSLDETLDIKAYVGVGSCKKIAKLHISYKESLECLRMKNDCEVVHISELKSKNAEYHQTMALEKELIETVRYGKKEASNLFFAILDAIRSLSNQDRVNKMMELLTLVSCEARLGEVTDLEHIDFYSSYDEVVRMNAEEQNRWGYIKFEGIIKSIRWGKIDRKSTTINSALEYIQLHYNEDISLNDISKYVNLSPQHFSKIFKEEIHENYVEYVANLRIAKAKELLNEKKVAIKEVCYLVGYQDPNYFSRIFKKYVGITPTEYVKERVD